MEKAYSLTDFYQFQIWAAKESFNYKYTDGGYKLSVEADQYLVSNGALRLTAIFFELLEKQFPINSIKQKMKFRFPVDFAGALSIHVNHLNKCLKDITGKTTSQLIAERMMKEAQILLSCTDWNICEIGYCLKFEEVSHFINFFKKYKNINPTAYRKIARSKHQNTLRSLFS